VLSKKKKKNHPRVRMCVCVCVRKRQKRVSFSQLAVRKLQIEKFLFRTVQQKLADEGEKRTPEGNEKLAQKNRNSGGKRKKNVFQQLNRRGFSLARFGFIRCEWWAWEPCADCTSTTAAEGSWPEAI
jgi:hypothetical protein